VVGGWGISTSDFGADEKCMELFGDDENWQYGPEAGLSVFGEEEISSKGGNPFLTDAPFWQCRIQ